MVRMLPSKMAWRRYGQSVILVVIATLLGQPIRVLINPTNLVMLYLLVVVISAVWLGRGPAVLSAFLGVLAFDVFFVPPRFMLGVADTQYLLTFAGLLLVGLVISALAAHASVQAHAARQREQQAIAGYELSRDLAAASEVSELLHVIMSHTARLFACDVAVCGMESGHVTWQAATPQFTADQNLAALVTQVWQSGKTTRAGVESNIAAGVNILPLQAGEKMLGVLVVKRRATDASLNSEQQRLLASFASQSALALERAQLARTAREAEILQAKEELQTTLLNSISHDLRTPLSSITGALSSLLDETAALTEATRRDLLENAWDEAARLNQLVSNLLDMTRLEAGAITVHRDPGDVQDLIGVVLARLGSRLGARPVSLDIPHDLPLVPMDFVLMVQVMVNLLDNALKYSGEGQPIAIRACTTGAHLRIAVADQGIGIPEDDREQVFAKFYRVPRADGQTGTGLGLSICKGIVEAHGGRIAVQRSDQEETVVTVDLPLTVSGDERNEA
ncbi:MAG: DUF4118 domain-containing protein [Caldilineaceae bacterium]|nr:DUF4118 domain-containing protein [Caldilineaceae bacterium]